ncbi:MAG: rRNA maturation RNase YbeY [Clostridiales bacterium]|jgi:probable rRNA maturation factor|nr:rRNA maturation RNase YbeY [Clostridiales bacterium]
MVFLNDFPPEFSGDINDVYAAALKYFKQRDVLEVYLGGVTKSGIKKINKKTRGVDAVTDVLSYPNLSAVEFPLKKSDYKNDINMETGKVMLGEILICLDRMKEQAEQFGHTAQRECCYLFLHGLLHLFGFDHEDDADKDRMRRAEEDILSSLNILR